jgi:LPXTG-motif cell wall-anchored protein
MNGVGTVVASIGAGAATDSATNDSTASTSTDNQVTFDNVAPTVTINQDGAQADPTSTSPITFDVLFSEPVTGFTDPDVDLSSSTAGGTLAASVAGSGATYTLTVTGMTTNGDVVAAIAASAATDLAGNPSGASTSTDNTVAWVQGADPAPTVTINQGSGQADPTSTSPITFDVLFSEPVTGFSAADVDLSSSTAGGTLAANVSGSGPGYTVTVTGMTTNGDVIATIPADAASDGTNASLASTSTDNTVTWTQGGTTTTTTTTTTPEDGSTTTTDPGAATTTLAGGSGGTGAANVNAAGAGVSPTAAARGAGSSLPSTGADAAVSVGMALSLLLIGAGLVLASRHQRSVASGRDPRGR